MSDPIVDLVEENIDFKEEIEMYKGLIKSHLGAIDRKDKKIERLNNIINKLEEYLEEIKDRVIMYGIDDDTYKTTNLYRDIKNKIKELKGSDKE